MTYSLQTDMLYDFYMRIEISLRANNQLELKPIQFDVYQTCNTFFVISFAAYYSLVMLIMTFELNEIFARLK
jgi:hypothetical protein